MRGRGCPSSTTSAGDGQCHPDLIPSYPGTCEFRVCPPGASASAPGTRRHKGLACPHLSDFLLLLLPSVNPEVTHCSLLDYARSLRSLSVTMSTSGSPCDSASRHVLRRVYTGARRRKPPPSDLFESDIAFSSLESNTYSCAQRCIFCEMLFRVYANTLDLNFACTLAIGVGGSYRRLR